MRSIFLDAIHGVNTGKTPIWLMRQAGRALPAYRQLRTKISLLEMFHRSDLINEVVNLPLQALDLDAAILFADLLTVLDGFGIAWDFEEGKGPLIGPCDLKNLHKKTAAEAYDYLGRAIRQLKQTLKVPLIGFSGAPFTVASYLIEKKTSRDLTLTKEWMYTDPEGFHALLRTLSDAIIDYLNYQIDAGVDALQIFDSWAHVLGINAFRTFIIPHLRYILSHLNNPSIPVILFCKGSCFFASELATLAPAAISLDWQGEISTIRSQIPRSIALQGNLDPSILLGSAKQIQSETRRILDSMRSDPGYVFNLGHGILPSTPFENLQTLVECVRDHS